MLKGFLLAVAAGTLAGTAFPVLILIIAVLGDETSTLVGMVSALVLIPLFLVASSALLLGIPATIALKLLRAESAQAYTIMGALLGFLVPGVILAFTAHDGGTFLDGLLANVLGAFSGGVTGRTWWRCYRKAASTTDLEPTLD